MSWGELLVMVTGEFGGKQISLRWNSHCFWLNVRDCSQGYRLTQWVKCLSPQFSECPLPAVQEGGFHFLLNQLWLLEPLGLVDMPAL